MKGPGVVLSPPGWRGNCGCGLRQIGARKAPGRERRMPAMRRLIFYGEWYHSTEGASRQRLSSQIEQDVTKCYVLLHYSQKFRPGRFKQNAIDHRWERIQADIATDEHTKGATKHEGRKGSERRTYL